MKRISAPGSVEIEARVDKNGSVHLPSGLAGLMRLRPGATVHVRITGRRLSQGLVERAVSEEEIARIAAMQLESRENVVTFLLSEGRLKAHKGFRTRAGRARR